MSHWTEPVKLKSPCREDFDRVAAHFGLSPDTKRAAWDSAQQQRVRAAAIYAAIARSLPEQP